MNEKQKVVTEFANLIKEDAQAVLMIVIDADGRGTVNMNGNMFSLSFASHLLQSHILETLAGRDPSKPPIVAK